MVAYGYRLYRFSAHAGGSRAALDLGHVGEGDASADALALLEQQLHAIEGHTFVGYPGYIGSARDLERGGVEDTRKNRPFLRVVTATRSGRRIRATVLYGREGDFENMLSADGSEPVSMQGRAATRTFRVWFLLPASGDTGFMISETKGRGYAGDALAMRLRVQSHFGASSIRNGDLQTGHWIRWRSEPLFDGRRIADLFQNSSDFKLTLSRYAHDRHGAPCGGTITVTEERVSISAVEKATEAVREWWTRRNEGTREARSQRAARDIGTLIDLDVNFEELGFNDGEVSFLASGKTLTIDPNKIDRLFLYPLGEEPPSEQEVLTDAAPRLQNISQDLSLPLDISTLI